MTTRPTDFQTSDIDLTAAVMAATGRQPGISRQPGQVLVTFTFPDDAVTQSTTIAYATGELCQPVRRFAAYRAWLYRQAKAVRP
jgi:hypothetical protein